MPNRVRTGRTERIQSGPINVGPEFDIPMRQTRRGLRSGRTTSIGAEIRDLVDEEARLQKAVEEMNMDQASFDEFIARGF